MSFLSQLLNYTDALCQLILLFLLLRGPFRKYLVFSLYVFAALATNPVELIAYHRFGWKSAAYRQLYWTDHVGLELLLFLVVIAFTYQALRESPLRSKAAKALGLIVAVAVLLPFTLLHDHHNPKYGFFTSQWFNHVSQIWNFGAAIMNLVLWGALLANRRRDPQLVTLSIGLGILTSSAAIGWGARLWLAEDSRWVVDMFMTLAEIGCVLLWCWVFRPKPQSRAGNAPPPSAAPPPNALTTPS